MAEIEDSPAPSAPSPYEVTAPIAFVTIGSTWTQLSQGERVPDGAGPDTIELLVNAGLIAKVKA